MNSVARLALALCIASIAFGAFAGAAAAQEPSETTPRLIIELDTNGDANAVFTDVYDLTDPDSRTAFEAAKEDEALRDAAATQLREQMQLVSDEANADLDREIRVGDVTIEMIEEGETGIVAYRFRWENLAVVEGDRIVLSEPFSTYDSLDRELIVFAPEGEELVSISPQPQRQGTDVASWPGLTQFGEGFEVVSTGGIADAPADTFGPIEHDDPTSETYGSAPIALGVSVLLLATLLVGRPR